MPFNVVPVDEGFKVKSPTSFKSKKPMTLQQANKQRKAIYAKYREKGKSVKSMKEEFKEEE